MVEEGALLAKGFMSLRDMAVAPAVSFNCKRGNSIEICKASSVVK